LEVLTGKRIKPYIGKKEAQKVMITITIVKFPVIAGYGTKYEIPQTLFM